MSGRARHGAAWMVLGAMLGLFLAGPAHATASGPRPREVRIKELERPDFEIFMDVDATKAEVAAVRRTLRKQTGSVTAFAHLDKKAAYAEFSRIFRDDPALIAKVRPGELPESFRVKLIEPDRNASAVLARVDGLPGVDTVVAKSVAAGLASAQKRAQLPECGGDPAVGLIAYLDVSARPDDERSVEAALRTQPGVAEIRYVSHDEALRRFRCIFGDSVAADVEASELPVSFDVVFESGAVSRAVARAISSIPGVESVALRALAPVRAPGSGSQHSYDIAGANGRVAHREMQLHMIERPSGTSVPVSERAAVSAPGRSRESSVGRSSRRCAAPRPCPITSIG